jgi:hypothetical protein
MFEGLMFSPPREVSIMLPLITVGDYVKMIEDGSILLPTDTDGFQRGVVWNDDKRRSYIAGLLSGLGKLSLIVLGKVESDKPYLVVDGLNRTDAILRFINGEFSVPLDGREVTFKDVENKFKAAQLLVSLVSVPSMEDLLKIFWVINVNQTKLRLTDVIFSKRVLDRRYKMIYELAKGLDVDLPPRADKLLYAFGLVYYIIEGKPIPYRRLYRRMVLIERWSEEEVAKAVEVAKTLPLPRKPDALPLVVLQKVHGIPREKLEGLLEKARRSHTEFSLAGFQGNVMDKLARIIESVFEGCKTERCSFKPNKVAAFAKEVDGELVSALRQLVKQAVAKGICEKKRGRYICEKRALIDMVKNKDVLLL